MLGGGQRGVQVVVQQPADRSVAVHVVVADSYGVGVFVEQVVQLVAAGGGLREQMRSYSSSSQRRAWSTLLSSRAAVAWASKLGPGTRPRRWNTRCCPR